MSVQLYNSDDMEGVGASYAMVQRAMVQHIDGIELNILALVPC
jgi:hypothetical protein